MKYNTILLYYLHHENTAKINFKNILYAWINVVFNKVISVFYKIFSHIFSHNTNRHDNLLERIINNMRLNTRISNETKYLIFKMQKHLVNEKGGCFVT